MRHAASFNHISLLLISGILVVGLPTIYGQCATGTHGAACEFLTVLPFASSLWMCDFADNTQALPAPPVSSVRRQAHMAQPAPYVLPASSSQQRDKRNAKTVPSESTSPTPYMMNRILVSINWLEQVHEHARKTRLQQVRGRQVFYVSRCYWMLRLRCWEIFQCGGCNQRCVVR